MPFAALVDNRLRNEHPRVPSEGIAPKIRSRHAGGQSCVYSRRSRENRARIGNERSGGEGADSRRRTREGDFHEWVQRWSASLQIAGGSARRCGENAGANFGDASNRPSWSRREQSSRSKVGCNRARNLFRHSARSRDGSAAGCRQHRRRRRDRNRRRKIAGENFARTNRSARGDAAISSAQACETIAV